MIKKNTKIIFEDGANIKSSSMVGGIPLAKGEVINVHEADQIQQYEVADKIVDCFLDGEDQSVDITYLVKKMKN